MTKFRIEVILLILAVCLVAANDEGSPRSFVGSLAAIVIVADITKDWLNSKRVKDG